MKAKELRELTDAEISAKLLDLKGELFNLRFSLTTGQLTNTNQLNTCKKDIARLKTIQKQREMVKSS
ncbi:MAG: 50S ribosomal protein L29 [Firmicutes bacterium]|nr:50S ribosomal protein L29 [Bacillota bacterium]MCL1954183.1 50S ribosomal protein L29 [Bacillota bacterium]